MKRFPKVSEDIYDASKGYLRPGKISSSLGSAEELSARFQAFYKDVHRLYFDFIVKQIWLEQQFMYGGLRRRKRHGNGFDQDRSFGYFMKTMVGFSQKALTTSFYFTAVATYLKDFFPDFLNHDPFKEPGYFEFPYRSISLDHLVFVYMVHNRLDLLKEAEERSMALAEFSNWAANWVMCYASDEGDPGMYVMANKRYSTMHIKNTTLKRGWSEEQFNFSKKI